MRYNEKNSYVIGVDGGGTKTHVCVRTTSGRAVGEGWAGPGNIHSNPTLSYESIFRAIREAFHEELHANESFDEALLSALSRSFTCMSLAGANLLEDPVGQLELCGPLPFAKLEVEHDIFSACRGAFMGEDGWLAIVGTGSAIAMSAGGEITRFGGWGFKLGDDASSAWLGHSALKMALQIHEGLAPSSDLGQTLLEAFDGDPLEIVKFAAVAAPTDFGRFAPYVFEFYDQGDWASKRIVAAGLDYLHSAMTTGYSHGLKQFCLHGGVAASWSRLLDERWKDLLVAPRGDATEGAVLRAEELATG